MRPLKCPYSFQLDDYRPTHYEVRLEGPDGLTTKPRRQRNFLVHLQSFSGQRDDHGLTVNRFQKSIAELVIHIKEHPNDFPGGLLVLVSAFICVHLRLVCYLDQAKCAPSNQLNRTG